MVSSRSINHKPSTWENWQHSAASVILWSPEVDGWMRIQKRVGQCDAQRKKRFDEPQIDLFDLYVIYGQSNWFLRTWNNCLLYIGGNRSSCPVKLLFPLHKIYTHRKIEWCVVHWMTATGHHKLISSPTEEPSRIATTGFEEQTEMKKSLRPFEEVKDKVLCTSWDATPN